MSLPYKVTVTKNGKEVAVKVNPPPVATKDEFIKVVSARIEGLIVQSSSRSNSWSNRGKLRRELTEALRDFHNQGLIKPKEGE